MATHSSILAYRIPWTEEGWWATACEVAKIQARLKWLNTHAHISWPFAPKHLAVYFLWTGLISLQLLMPVNVTVTPYFSLFFIHILKLIADSGMLSVECIPFQDRIQFSIRYCTRWSRPLVSVS